MNDLLTSRLGRDLDWTDVVPWSENRPGRAMGRSQNDAFLRLAETAREAAKVPLAVANADDLLTSPGIVLRRAAKMHIALPEDARAGFISGSFLLGDALRTFRAQQSYVLGLTWPLADGPGRLESRAAQSPSAYDTRINELKSYAAEQNVDVSTASEAALIQFVGSCSDTGEASLFLPLENGRFTARWVGDRSRLSIEFRGNDAIEYVVLWERADGSWDGVSCETTVEEFWDAYEHMEVEHLLRRT